MGKNNDNDKNQNDEQLLRITNDLEYEYRQSGYFVHDMIEVNKHYEKITPYLYHKTKFPKEIISAPQKHKKSRSSSSNQQYFLYEEDEQKFQDNEEIQRMISVNSQNNSEQVIIGGDDKMDEDDDQNKDIVLEMENYLSDQGDTENEFEFANFSGDEGCDGRDDGDMIDQADGEEEY